MCIRDRKETPVSVTSDKKRDGWQSQPPQMKGNEQELPHNELEESKSFQKVEKGSRGRGANAAKNLPPRLKSQNEPSGPGRGRGGASGRKSSGERRGPGELRGRGTHESVEEKRVSTEPAADKDKTHVS